VCLWPGIGDRWPWTVAPTAAAMMGLYTDTAEALARHDRTTAPSPDDAATEPSRPSASLLTAGLVTAGDEVGVEPPPPRCVRHTARIRGDGTL